jgi:hypothetical protein
MGVDWWQIVLILLASIVGGTVVGALLSYLILRFVRKRKKTFLSNLSSRSSKKPEAPPVVAEQVKLTVPGLLADELLAEVKQNRKIAAEPLGDNLLPFQTGVWDAHQYEVDRLSADLRDDLEQAYTDMRLANSLVWLSTEFSHRTPSLNDNYAKLRASIAERLDKINSLIEKTARTIT